MLFRSARRSAGAQRSSAPQGPPRPRAAPTGPSGASGRSEETALALSAISERLQRTWNPNCAAPGGDQLRVRVTIELNRDGSLKGAPRADGAADGDTVRGVAVQRAVAAIRAAEPFDTLPPERYAEWRQPITINFNAREACRR